MRRTPVGFDAIWASGNFTGVNRPIARVTVQRPQMNLHTHSGTSTFTRKKPTTSGMGDILNESASIDPTRGQQIQEVFADYLFTPQGAPKELPNVRSVEWTRSTDADIAECTVQLWNTRPLDIGEMPTNDDLDLPGWYTFNRGRSTFSSRWGHEANEWSQLLAPDNIIRTYEGYGFTPEVAPERDPKLMLTGVWLIDKIELTARGQLTLQCRDMGRLLLDHIAWVPVIPNDFYPLSFQNWEGRFLIGQAPPEVTEVGIRPSTNSNVYWDAPAGTGGDPNGSLSGHRQSDAFDGNPGTYWLSVGNSTANRRFSYEWIEASVPNTVVSEVRVRTVKFGYTCFVSVYADGKWQGNNIINYNREGVGRNDSNIPYLDSAYIRTENETRIVLSIPQANVTKVRLTFYNLQDFGFGTFGPWRVGVSGFRAYGASGVATNVYQGLRPGPAAFNPGRVGDYTDIVKLLCAWGGFWWPKGGFFRLSDDTQVSVSPPIGDPMFAGIGRVWGDFQDAGTANPAEITADVFDKKPLMDGIAYIRDILGFLFHIDESGGVQWRLPNLYDLGNWITGLSSQPGRTRQMYVLDERTVLTDLTAVLSSANVREGVFVGSVVGNCGAIVGGFNPNPTGLRRVGGWTDQNFESVTEAQVMADMITVRQMFQYRTDNVRIPGNPGIQMDDQIRVLERVTSEGFIHYVKGVSSRLDMVEGTWHYDLQTHWLGDDPTNGSWVVQTDRLRQPTQDYLNNIRANHPAFFGGRQP